ncbi:polysaccharide pyruvyl transferase family protein [Saccharicrinis aurantiacus]|uniref:polysaccharide pyruvyl transferase family protein n=1 Tax=Saccharicrinis aurantiacus TaxID=1849719 RepID=UPI00095018C1|nr:polysaccharide pyruvyl transferase family protein [Saccharicrinis aurantiacus]
MSKIVVKSDQLIRNVAARLDLVKSKGVINLHRCDTENVGDLVCAPYLYFEELSQFKIVDILGSSIQNPTKALSWYKSIMYNDIILGGGGLLDRASFKETIGFINELLKKGKKVVPWGIGHNSPILSPTSLYFKQVLPYKLIGVRDFEIANTSWVPCVSCMHESFKSVETNVTSEFGVVIHEHINISNINKDMRVLRNNSSFSEIVNFIASVEKVITNSYHAMYWAMLLNKQVFVIPNSSKMFGFKYKPIFIKDTNEVYKSRVRHDYSGVLEECRMQNILFKDKVFDYLNI